MASASIPVPGASPAATSGSNGGSTSDSGSDSGIDSGSGSARRSWAYAVPGSRDLRIDYIRGLVMISLVVVHIEIFSAYNLAVWERLGVVSSAEAFVMLSGMVIGMVYGKKLRRSGIGPVLEACWNRSMTLYKANVFVICSIPLLAMLPGVALNVDPVSTFTNHASGEVYQLFPPEGTPFHAFLGQALMLRIGPHQLQILGLYVVLLATSPLLLWAFLKGWGLRVLGLSWVLYFINWAEPARPTGAQFEYAFPLLSWQLIFVHGVAVGYFRDELTERIQGGWRTALLAVAGVATVAFMLFSLNNPNPSLPEWARLGWIDPGAFHHYYDAYFRKNSLGLLRVLNYSVLLIVGYALLSRVWQPLYKATGWFFIPMGQNSLYVFIVHVYFCVLVASLAVFSNSSHQYVSVGEMWLNTAGHLGVLMTIWFMVKREWLFDVVPR